MAVAGGCWVEHAGELVLGFGREVLLVLEEEDLVGVQSPADCVEICGIQVFEVGIADFCA